jgi:hypothetical protein
MESHKLEKELPADSTNLANNIVREEPNANAAKWRFPALKIICASLPISVFLSLPAILTNQSTLLSLV